MKHAARENLKEYAVWDRTTRWFHWINFAVVSGLAGIGTVLLYANALGIGDNGKFALKAVHVLTGYVFCLNLLWRIVWGFIGNRYARWAAVLPFGKGYLREAREYLAGFSRGDAPGWLGHNFFGKADGGRPSRCPAGNGRDRAHPRRDRHLLSAARRHDEGLGR